MVLVLAPSYAMIGAINLTSREDSGVEWIMQDLKGWGTSAGTLAPAQKTRQAGAWGGLSYAKARSIVATGACVAPTAAMASDALDRLIAECSLDDSTLTVTESGRSRWATVRRDGDVLPVWLGATAFTYSVQLVAVDPRKFGATLTASTSLPSPSGGLTIPYTIPYSINTTQVTGQVSLTNPGNTAGPVRLRIDGPVTGPVVTHVGTGLRLVFATSLVLGVGEFLTVDMEARSVLAQGQVSRSNWVTQRGWSSLEPGPNTWSFTSATYDPAARLTVSADPSWQ